MLLISIASHSKIIPFNEGFENMETADSGKGKSDLSKLGWKVTGKVFNFNEIENIKFPGKYLYFYGKWFPAPNNSSGSFSGISEDENKNKFLNIFNDYNNRGAHEKGLIVNSIFAKEFKISEKDLNKRIILSFKAKRPDKITYGSDIDYGHAIGNDCKNICKAQAFIKILDPKNQWSVSRFTLIDTSNLSQNDWSKHSIELEIDNKELQDQVIQIGFETFATGDDKSGVYYDNVSLKIND